MASHFLNREFWSKLLSTKSGSPVSGERRFTFDELRGLYDVLDRNPVVHEGNRALVVETIRSTAEFMIWGDQHEPKIFEFFLENNVMAYLHRVLLQPANRSGDVAKQVLQTLGMIIQNVRSETGIFFLFSNNHVNSIVEIQFDLEDEEVMGFYISFLKAISLKLTPQTVHFFLVEGNGTEPPTFPLYAEAAKLAHHKEGMVRAGVRTLTLNVFTVPDPYIHAFITSPPFSKYFFDCASYLSEQVKLLDRQILAAESFGQLQLSSLDSQLAEVEDIIAYCADVMQAAHPYVAHLLAQQLWSIVFGPNLLLSLLLEQTTMANDLAGKLGPIANGVVRPRCALYILERMFNVLAYRPLIHNMLVALLSPYSPPGASGVDEAPLIALPGDGTSATTSGPNPNHGLLAPLHVTVKAAEPLPPGSHSTGRSALIAIIRGEDQHAVASGLRMLVAASRSGGASPDVLQLLGLLIHNRLPELNELCSCVGTTTCPLCSLEEANAKEHAEWQVQQQLSQQGVRSPGRGALTRAGTECLGYRMLWTESKRPVMPSFGGGATPQPEQSTAPPSHSEANHPAGTSDQLPPSPPSASQPPPPSPPPPTPGSDDNLGLGLVLPASPPDGEERVASHAGGAENFESIHPHQAEGGDPGPLPPAPPTDLTPPLPPTASASPSEGPSPDLGGPSPHVGVPSRDLGGPSPHVGVPSPDLGRPSPHVEGPSPDLGGPSPHVGVPSPDLGGPSPHVGGPSPDLGGPSPHVGVPSPDLGGPSPHVEGPSPDLGVPSPHVGVPSPDLGGPSPHVGGASLIPVLSPTRHPLDDGDELATLKSFGSLNLAEDLSAASPPSAGQAAAGVGGPAGPSPLGSGKGANAAHGVGVGVESVSQANHFPRGPNGEARDSKGVDPNLIAAAAAAARLAVAAAGGGEPAQPPRPARPTCERHSSALGEAPLPSADQAELRDAMYMALLLQLLPVQSLWHAGFLLEQLSPNAKLDAQLSPNVSLRQFNDGTPPRHSRSNSSVPSWVVPGSAPGGRGPRDMNQEEGARLQLALAAAVASALDELGGMWCEAVFPLIVDEWPKASDGLLRPRLKTTAETLILSPAMYPLPGGPAASNQLGLSNSAVAALLCFHSIQRLVALLQIHMMLVGGLRPSREAPLPMLENVEKRTLDIAEGQEVDLMPACAIPCVVSFAPGQERRVYFSVAGVSLARAQEFLDGNANMNDLAHAQLLHSSAALVLADPAPSKLNAGVVLSVSPLLGCDPITDKNVAKWLHVHVRPSVRGLLRVLRNALTRRGGVLIAVRQLADGHWVLAFPDAERAANARGLVDQNNTRVRTAYGEILEAMCADVLGQNVYMGLTMLGADGEAGSSQFSLSRASSFTSGLGVQRTNRPSHLVAPDMV